MAQKQKKSATSTNVQTTERLEQKKQMPTEIDHLYGIMLDEEQKVFANSILNVAYDLVICNSRAGTGKTFVAFGATNLLIKYGFYNKLIYVMSPYAERSQGYLPGTIEDKSSVYFEPLYQAAVKCGVNLNTALISEIENPAQAQSKTKPYIKCITDTFLRGQNLDDAVVIIDEAQNYTTAQLKKILTRIGTNTKVVLIGHDKQCDIKASESGFMRYLDHFKDMPRATVCELKKNHRGWISEHADMLEE